MSQATPTSKEKTLVGRMAWLQLGVMSLAIALVVGLSFLTVTGVLGRQRDELLLGVAERTLASLSQYGGRSGDPAAVLHEVEEHRPAGVRVEVVEGGDHVVAAAGEGPSLGRVGGEQCADRADLRICARADAETGLAVVAGKSLAEERATMTGLFRIVLAASALVLALGAALTRFVAGRGLAPLSDLSSYLASVEPGERRGPAPAAGLREIDEVSSRFDDLLGRIDAAMARERRFSAQASHELRTPLTVLRGELEMALRDPSSSAEATQRALASTDTMVRLVEVLLLFSRAESKFQAKELELVNLCDLVRDELARAGADGKRDPGRIRARLPEEALVFAEEPLLVHAIANLIDNACKHTPDGTAIEISVELSPSAVLLRVADGGTGIAAGYEERIFEPFFRDPAARARTEGHGLGLPFARSVARAHGGDVSLERHRTPGASFVMSLPRQADDAAGEPAQGVAARTETDSAGIG